MKQYHLESKTFDDLVSDETGNLQTHGKDWVRLTSQDDINAVSQAITTGGEVWLDATGSLKTSPPRPSPTHKWDSQSKTWVLDTAKQAEAEKTAFQAAKSAKLAELANAAQAFVDKHAKTDVVPAFEQETWAMQGAEARAWAEDDNAPTPVLDGIAKHRGIDRIALIRAALRKTQQYEMLAACVAGQRQALQVQIERAKTLDDLAAVEIAFRLPETEG